MEVVQSGKEERIGKRRVRRVEGRRIRERRRGGSIGRMRE